MLTTPSRPVGRGAAGRAEDLGRARNGVSPAGRRSVPPTRPSRRGRWLSAGQRRPSGRYLHLVGEAFELVAAAKDGRAALAAAGALIADPDQAPRRFATAMELAIADGCDVHLASFGVITYGFLATDVPDQARRYATAIAAAIARPMR